MKESTPNLHISSLIEICVILSILFLAIRLANSRGQPTYMAIGLLTCLATIVGLYIVWLNLQRGHFANFGHDSLLKGLLASSSFACGLCGFLGCLRFSRRFMPIFLLNSPINKAGGLEIIFGIILGLLNIISMSFLCNFLFVHYLDNKLKIMGYGEYEGEIFIFIWLLMSIWPIMPNIFKSLVRSLKYLQKRS